MSSYKIIRADGPVPTFFLYTKDGKTPAFKTVSEKHMNDVVSDLEDGLAKINDNGKLTYDIR